MKSKTGTINRRITKEECHWIPRNIDVGEHVTEYRGCTYGCVSPSGEAVIIDGIEGFLEVPSNSITWEVHK